MSQRGVIPPTYFFLKSGVFVEFGHLVNVFFSTCARYNKWLVLAVDTKQAFLLEELNIGLNMFCQFEDSFFFLF